MTIQGDLSTVHEPDGVYRILSLDGGGAKGFYTLGVLQEIEAVLNCHLHKRFDLIFGTSTGSIIAALLALGHSVKEITEFYTEHVPKVTGAWFPWTKSSALRGLSEKVFRQRGFNEVKTGVGIVATNWDAERPMIFKNDPAQAHGRPASFVPGFGVTVGDAVEASCAAYPYLMPKKLATPGGKNFTLIDGGYCANNPSLYALADAVGPLKKDHKQIRLVSVGVGVYPQKGFSVGTSLSWALKRTFGLRLAQKTFEINTQSMEWLNYALFKHIPTVRINNAYPQPEMATDLFEADLGKLNVLLQRGADSFGEQEVTLRKYLLTAEGD